MWTKPQYTEMRLGFEVTLYINNRQATPSGMMNKKAADAAFFYLQYGVVELGFICSPPLFLFAAIANEFVVVSACSCWLSYCGLALSTTEVLGTNPAACLISSVEIS